LLVNRSSILKQFAYLLVLASLAIAAGIGCGPTKVSSDAGAPIVDKPTAAQQKATSQDIASARAQGAAVPTYSTPPTNAPQGAGYRIAPANPNAKAFQPDPKIIGIH